MKTLINSFPDKFWTMIHNENFAFEWNKKEYFVVQTWKSVEIYFKGILVIELHRWDKSFKEKLQTALT